jgi:argininosuccinate synthase
VALLEELNATGARRASGASIWWRIDSRDEVRDAMDSGRHVIMAHHELKSLTLDRHGALQKSRWIMPSWSITGCGSPLRDRSTPFSEKAAETTTGEVTLAYGRDSAGDRKSPYSLLAEYRQLHDGRGYDQKDARGLSI